MFSHLVCVPHRNCQLESEQRSGGIFAYCSRLVEPLPDIQGYRHCSFLKPDHPRDYLVAALQLLGWPWTWLLSNRPSMAYRTVAAGKGI